MVNCKRDPPSGLATGAGSMSVRAAVVFRRLMLVFTKSNTAGTDARAEERPRPRPTRAHLAIRVKDSGAFGRRPPRRSTQSRLAPPGLCEQEPLAHDACPRREFGAILYREGVNTRRADGIEQPG